MRINNSIDHLRNTALVLGVLAAVPLAAQAMLMENDTARVEPGSSVSADKQLYGDTDSALAHRMGTYSGFGPNRSGTVNVQSGTENTESVQPQSDDIYNRLP